MPKWHERIPADWPPPKKGEGQSKYFLRARLVLDKRNIDNLAEAVRKRRDEV